MKENLKGCLEDNLLTIGKIAHVTEGKLMILTCTPPFPTTAPWTKKNRSWFLIPVYLQILFLENNVSYTSVNQLSFSLIETIIPYYIETDSWYFL